MPRGNGNLSSSSSHQMMVDADALVGVTDERDALHQWAVRTSVLLKKNGTETAISNFSFGEAVTIISQRLGKKIAAITVEEISSSMTIVDATLQQRLAATDRFLLLQSKNARFTDCINMAIMDELGIDTIFSHDIHYKKAGYKRFGIDTIE